MSQMTVDDTHVQIGLREDEVARALDGIDPLRHLPASLNEAALGFLGWLGAADDSVPTSCAHCGSPHFGEARQVSGVRRRVYYCCRRCHRRFHNLTGTALRGLHHPHLWRAYMSLRFAGWSIPLIATHLKISHHAASRWNREFLVEMQRRAPSLHDWWRTHQRREDLTMPTALDEQANAFLRWVDELVRDRSRRADTPFEKLAVEEDWPTFARMLIHGSSDADIERELSMNHFRCARWRRRFEAVIEIRWPLLHSWSRWQRGRRYRAVRGKRRLEESLTDDPALVTLPALAN
ncbi:hypothetical protein AWB71_05895 [Caballeronia peredens]|nr:hypothetical protein AWB71_05895 [Caballeronia peredens]